MHQQSPDLRGFAARLAGGPAFLILGGIAQLSTDSPSATYRWSGVYTSKTTKAVADGLRTKWRTVSSVGAMSATASRSQTDLQVCYLFGGEHLPDNDRPPTNVLQEADSRIRALQELTRLASETITPRGTVVIDGWKSGDKLVSPELVPALRQLGPGQAHLFSATAWSDDPYIKSLAATGQLVLHDETLDEALTALADTGAVKLDTPASGAGGTQHVIALGNEFVEIDIHTWNQIRRSARPVDLELLTPPVFSSDAARYQEFRNFAGAPEGSPRWRGIAAGMNVARDFELALLNAVTELLQEQGLPDPVVLTGQTATGKSVAMATLAMNLARQGEYAVLHQSRRTVRPSFDDVDMYAGWAEERGAKGTILIWDGMVHSGEYEALARQLHNRGRKVLIIGSAYVTSSDSTDLNSSLLIPAPAELSKGESARLLVLLKSFGINFAAPKAALDSSFLAFLYHTLPDTEFALRQGLSYEMRAAEKGMEKLVRERGSEATPESRVTAMAAALQAAGVALPDLLPDPGTDEKPLNEQTFGERSSIQRVTTLVIVAGRHGVPVPIDLALRILGREGSQSIRDALRTFDIIREVDDDSGEYFLAARSHLEAELLAQHEVPLEVEIEVLTEAIRNVRIVDGYAGGADEVQFIVSLLERIGPNSLASKYKPFFLEVSDALRDRREDSGKAHPRLVLQESTFARAYVHWQQEVQQESPVDRISRLEHNSDLLNGVLADTNLRGMMRLSLTVELASTLGAIMHEVQKDGTSSQAFNLVGRLDDILQAVMDARAIDPSNLRPVDVLAWSTRDAILTEALSPEERLDRLANAVAMIESIDRAGLNDKQRAQLDMRLTQLQQLLGNDDAVWQRLKSLEVNADPAATYFLAKFEAEGGPAGERAALDRLWAAPPATQQDWRCAQLLLELTWKDLTGGRLLQGERVAIHLSDETLRKLLRLAMSLHDADLPDRYKLLFVQALAYFVLGNYSEAGSTFREVEFLTRQLARRIYTVVVLADESGKPVVHTGRIESVGGNWGKVRVEELATTIWFEPRLFSASQEFARNQQLPGFIVGFKLSRGAVAEPRSMIREPQNR
jgi:TolA-binding protein